MKVNSPKREAIISQLEERMEEQWRNELRNEWRNELRNEWNEWNECKGIALAECASYVSYSKANPKVDLRAIARMKAMI